MRYKMLEVSHNPELVTNLMKPENEDYHVIGIVSHRSLIVAYLEKNEPKPQTQIEKMNAAKAAKKETK